MDYAPLTIEVNVCNAISFAVSKYICDFTLNTESEVLNLTHPVFVTKNICSKVVLIL